MTYLIETGSGMRMLTDSSIAAATFIAKRGACLVETGDQDIIHISPMEDGAFLGIKPLSEKPAHLMDNDVHLFSEIGKASPRTA